MLMYIVVVCLILIGIKRYYINKGFDEIERRFDEQNNLMIEQKYRIDELENILKNHTKENS